MEETKQMTIKDNYVDEQSNKEIVESDLGIKEPKEQTREENSYFAKLRRENEKLKNEKETLENKLKESKISSVKSFVDSDIMSELGLEEITSEEDIALVEFYKDAKKSGDDNPVRTAYNSLYRKSQESRKADNLKLEEERKNKELVDRDAKEFVKKFGISVNEALDDKDFMGLFEDQIGFGNLTALYGKYKTYIDKKKDVDKSKGSMDFTNIGSGIKNSSDPLEGLEGEAYLKAFNELYGH